MECCLEKHETIRAQHKLGGKKTQNKERHFMAAKKGSTSGHDACQTTGKHKLPRQSTVCLRVTYKKLPTASGLIGGCAFGTEMQQWNEEH